MDQRSFFKGCLLATGLLAAIAPSVLPTAGGWNAIAQAQADTGVYGKNIARADFDGGSLRQTGPQQWGEYDANGQLIGVYQEVVRDDWAVEMRDPNRPERYVSIDLYYNQLFRLDSEGVLNPAERITSLTPNRQMPRIARPPLPAFAQQQVQQADTQPWQGGEAVPVGGNTNGGGQVTSSQPWQGGQAVSTDTNNTGTSTGSASGAAPWETSQPQQAPAQQGGFNPFGGSGTQQQGTTSWAQGNTSAPAPTPAPSSPPPWQQQGQSQGNSSSPPWAGGAAGGSSAAASEPVAPADVAEQYAGVWVQENVSRRPSGDGLTKAVTWTEPKYIAFERVDPQTLVLRMDDSPTVFMRLTKQSDTRFSGSGLTATFSQYGDSQSVVLSGTGTDSRDRYAMARVADGRLSKTRFSTATGEDRTVLYGQDGLVKEWNNNFYGYDGLKMDPINPRSGQTVMIFKQPGRTDYALDDDMNLGLPYGLRGSRVRTSANAEREAVITNASEYQKSLSLNFGGGSPFFAVDYSANLTKGGAVTRSSLKAYSLVNIERYTLFLDPPNAELSDRFKRDVERLASNQMTPQSFISSYGSHYAKAITYGGIAKAEKIMTSEEFKKWRSFEFKGSASGTFKGVTGSAGGGYSQSNASSNSRVFTNKDFRGYGGNGAANLEAWQVNDDDSIPVRYDLRPISDLISPIYFSAGNDVNKSLSYSRARARLADAVDAYMRSGAGKIANIRPLVYYELEIKALRCTKVGDDDDKYVELTGDITLELPGSNLLPSSLFHAVSERRIYCGPRAPGFRINSTFELDPGKTRFRIVSSNLLENDPTVFDKDEAISGSSRGSTYDAERLTANRSTVVRSETFTGGTYAPTLVLDYEIRKIQ